MSSRVTAAIEALADRCPDLWSLSGVGVTRSETVIQALLARDAYARADDQPRVLLVSGLSGRAEDVDAALRILRTWSGRSESPAALTAVPCLYPNGVAVRGEGISEAAYPPQGGYYDDPDGPEERYLWRWTCLLAPDLVVEVRAGDSAKWECNEAAEGLAAALDAAPVLPPDGFVGAIGRGVPEGIGSVPGVRLTAGAAEAPGALDRLWPLLAGDAAPSRARLELDRRRARSPVEIGRALGSAYGHTIEPVVYTQGVAISGRLRLAALDPESPSPASEIADLVEPLADPATAFHDGKEVGVDENFAAFVWGDELAEATGDRRFSDILVEAAGRYSRQGPGQAPPPARPNFPTEDHFFVSAVLGRGFSLTGDASRIDILADFLLDGGIQQDSGLFLHSRTGPFHWGRGNGFAALGLAETLTSMPADHPKRGRIEEMAVRHMTALRERQEASGMVRQVVDFIGSYQELTATCMVGYGLARGLRLGWLDSSFRETAELAWRGVSERIDDRGNIIDACTGTGNGLTLRHYLDREALTGFDDRSGSMALWFAAEIERLRRESPVL